MSKSTTPRQPIAPKRDAKAELTAFLAERRRAYAEAAFVAFCQNSAMVDNFNAKELADKAVKSADALIDAIFVNPLAEAAKNVSQGK